MVNFINTFLSYILLMVIILVVGACGFIVGQVLRKRKNAKLLAQQEENNE